MGPDDFRLGLTLNICACNCNLERGKESEQRQKVHFCESLRTDLQRPRYLCAYLRNPGRQ